MAGRRTRLTVNRAFLDEEFGYLGGYEGLLFCLKKGPRWANPFQHTDFHWIALNTHRIWRSESRPSGYPELPDNAPPYLPFLAALCLAWTIDDEDTNLAGNDFYGRLELIIPSHGMNSQELGLWKPLWLDLEKWSESLRDKRGIWKLEKIGYEHVGIPCSQAILTPCKIRRLPELFHLTGLSSFADRTSNVSPAELTSHLLNKESYTRSILGNFLTGEIRKKSEIGRGVIQLLVEQLEVVDNRSYDPEAEHGEKNSSKSEPKTFVDLKFAIKFSNKPPQWHFHLGLIGVIPPTKIHLDRDWDFRKIDHRLGGFWVVQNRDMELDASKIIDVNQGSIRKELVDENIDGDTDFSLRTKPRSIRVFKWINNNFLIEHFNLPNVGECYLFSLEDTAVELKNWVEKLKSSGGITRMIPQNGLPKGTCLFYVDKIERANKPLLDDFPESRARPVLHRKIKLQGGSRIQSGGSERVYLSYDLPQVVLETSGNDVLHAEGAILSSEEDSFEPSDVAPGIRYKQFTLTPIEPCSSIKLILLDISTNEVVEEVFIGVKLYQTAFSSNDSKTEKYFDKYGRVNPDGGILGAITKFIQDPPKYTNETTATKHELNSECPLTSYASSIFLGWKLLESISLKQRLPGPEFKRRYERITGNDSHFCWQDLRWLQALGHIEVEKDKKGRIAYVYSVQPHAYQLPWTLNKQPLFAVSGCLTQANLDSLRSNLEILECNLLTWPSYSKTLPVPIIVSGDLENVSIALGDAGIDCDTRAIASEYIANWAGDIEGVKANLNWLPGSPASPKAVFNPYKFRLIETEAFACPMQMLTIPDSYSPKNKSIVLLKMPGANDSDINSKYVFLDDASWGKWISIERVTEGLPGFTNLQNQDFIPVPYDSRTCELIVPASSGFPPMLERALVMCSGTPPLLIENSKNYEQGSYFLPDSSLPYFGRCWSYRYVPIAVAEIVCAKVNAWPIDINSKSKTAL